MVASTTTDRPILFAGPMVRAILDGRKIQTRRPIKNAGLYAIDPTIHGRVVAQRERKRLATRCPYGQPGDRLWVREAWATDRTLDALAPSKIGPRVPLWWDAERTLLDEVPNGWGREGNRAGPWIWSEMVRGRGRPSIHMPRWASRLTLEVADVRVERLQEITEDDAIAEGMEPDDGPAGFLSGPAGHHYDPTTHRGVLARSWHARYAKRGLGWDANPSVWVVAFARTDA